MDWRATLPSSDVSSAASRVRSFEPGEERRRTPSRSADRAGCVWTLSPLECDPDDDAEEWDRDCAGVEAVRWLTVWGLESGPASAAAAGGPLGGCFGFE